MDERKLRTGGARQRRMTSAARNRGTKRLKESSSHGMMNGERNRRIHWHGRNPEGVALEGLSR